MFSLSIHILYRLLRFCNINNELYTTKNLCHYYNTIYCNQFRIPKHRLILRENGVYYAVIQHLLNQLPTEEREERLYSRFSPRFKELLLHTRNSVNNSSKCEILRKSPRKNTYLSCLSFYYLYLFLYSVHNHNMCLFYLYFDDAYLDVI